MPNLTPSLPNSVKKTLEPATMIIGTIGRLIYYGQRLIIYPDGFPPRSKRVVRTPRDHGFADYQDLMLMTKDGVKIRAYLLLQSQPMGSNHSEAAPTHSYPTFQEFGASRPIVICFHGNAFNMGEQIKCLDAFYCILDFNVLLVSYRGYAGSTGAPSEKGLKIDAQTALDYVTSHPVLAAPSATPGSGPKIFLYGQSLGGAVALYLAATNPNTVTGVIVENTFLSIPRLVSDRVPFIAWLCRQKWNNADAITKLPSTMALLMLSGGKDEVVPPHHMAKLWHLAQKSGRRNETFERFQFGTHTGTFPMTRNTIVRFAKDVIGEE